MLENLKVMSMISKRKFIPQMGIPVNLNCAANFKGFIEHILIDVGRFPTATQPEITKLCTILANMITNLNSNGQFPKVLSGSECPAFTVLASVMAASSFLFSLLKCYHYILHACT